MVRVRARFAVGLVGTALAFAPARVYADTDAKPAPTAMDVASARAHYKLGVELYERGSYPEALVELHRAYEIAPTPKLLYNLALVQMRLGDPMGALRSLDAYVSASGAQITPARRAEVAKLVSECNAQLATVAVTTNVEAAEISLDEAPAGTSPLTVPLRMNAGHHRVTVAKEGYVRATREIDPTPGAQVDLHVPLDPTPPPEPAPVATPVTPPPAPPVEPAPALVTSPTPPEKPRASSTPWVGWVVTGSLAVGAIATGIAALSESHSLSQELAQPTAGATLRSSHDTTVGLALVSDVLAAGAIVAGGISLYLTVVPQKGPEGSKTAEMPAIGVGGRF